MENKWEELIRVLFINMRSVVTNCLFLISLCGQLFWRKQNCELQSYNPCIQLVQVPPTHFAWLYLFSQSCIHSVLFGSLFSQSCIYLVLLGYLFFQSCSLNLLLTQYIFAWLFVLSILYSLSTVLLGYLFSQSCIHS